MDSSAASRVRPAGESPLVEQITRAMQICYRAAEECAWVAEEDCMTTDDDLPEEADCTQPATERYNRKRSKTSNLMSHEFPEPRMATDKM